MTKRILKKVLILAIATFLAVPHARAVRPFITDDAAVMGFRRSELASWIFASKTGTEFWHSANFGLTNWAELTVAGFWGYSKPANDELRRKFSYTLPLLQTKILLRDYVPNGLPGVTLAFGSDLPFGKGAFVPGGYGAFGFLSLTQCFGNDENVLVHANIGGTYLREEGINHHGLTWGLGTQIKAYKGMHGIAEIVSGDPYIHGAGFAYQLGIRQFVSDALQIDVAFGKGLGGENRMPSWITAGMRYVLAFDKKNGGGYARNGRKIN
jgi:hypothetical protein